MIREKLRTLVKEYSERNKRNNCSAVYSVTNSHGFMSSTDYFSKEVFSKDLSTYKIVRRGMIAYNPSRINVGSVAVQRAKETVIVSPLYVVFSVDENKILPEFLTYFLHSDTGLQQIAAHTSGSVRDSLKFGALQDIEINLYSIEEQREIIAKLQKVDDLLECQRTVLKRLDDLVKSQFIEMFGHPQINEKGYPLLTVEDVIEFQGGSQPDKSYFEYEKTENNVRLIQIRDYKTDKFLTYIPKNLVRRYCYPDDIMIGRYGPPIFQILQGIEGAFNVALMKATPKRGNREFVRYFLKQDCLLHYLEGLSKRTAGQDGIQMDKLKKYPFPYPPIELQNQFAAFVEQTDKSKVLMERCIFLVNTLRKVEKTKGICYNIASKEVV